MPRFLPVARVVFAGIFFIVCGAGIAQEAEQPPDEIPFIGEKALTGKDRFEASQQISEDTQSAASLRKLLRDRHLIFFGRVEGDAAYYADPPLDDDSGVELRRARLGVAGVNPWFEHMSFKLELNLVDLSDIDFSSAYIKFDRGELGSMTWGYQSVYQSLSSSTGSLSQLFMEDPLPVAAFSVANRLAVTYAWSDAHKGFNATLFGHDMNHDRGGKGFAGRAYFSPYRSKDAIWHFGGSWVRESLDEPDRLRTRPESHVTDQRLVSTGRVGDVDHRTTFSLEMAGAKNSGTGRIEFFMTEWDRGQSPDNRFVGAYWEIGYMLTGQSFRYRQGKFVRPLLEHGRSAWELAARFSWVDLDDKDIQGGAERNFGVGVNWYPRPNLRGMFNLIQVDTDNPGEDGPLAQIRLQLNW